LPSDSDLRGAPFNPATEGKRCNSQKVRKHFLEPHNVGPLKTRRTRGGRAAGQGNYMVLQLRVESGRIAAAAFQTYGCVGAISSGCELTDMVTGKTVAEALSIQPEDLLRSLGDCPWARSTAPGSPWARSGTLWRASQAEGAGWRRLAEDSMASSVPSQLPCFRRSSCHLSQGLWSTMRRT